LLVDGKTGRIICAAHDTGKCHDFKLYAKSIGNAVLNRIEIKADSGYQGILRLHKNSQTPKKKPKGGSLTEQDKRDNYLLSSQRILIENINAKVKVFKITANKYRNRRKRFGLRMALICAIINFELP